MKWLSKLKETVFFCGLVMIPSCTLPEKDTSSLVGCVYIDEETSDRIAFIGKGRIERLGERKNTKYRTQYELRAKRFFDNFIPLVVNDSATDFLCDFVPWW